MTYSVFVKPTRKQGYNAIVLGFPFLQAEGVTKKEAIDNIQKLLANLMASGEIVQVDVDDLAIASLDEIYNKMEQIGMDEKEMRLSYWAEDGALPNGFVWLAKLHPELFNQLAGEFPEVRAFL
jgi:uncharacterized protein YoaH (UPF0181 family)